MSKIACLISQLRDNGELSLWEAAALLSATMELQDQYSAGNVGKWGTKVREGLESLLKEEEPATS